ncbi:hypothetical protein NQZ68_038652 [Dissostichus eleginoides]|nr:hypothetical protein NQZ68_038652 [Dissostichus eleginoides]
MSLSDYTKTKPPQDHLSFLWPTPPAPRGSRERMTGGVELLSHAGDKTSPGPSGPPPPAYSFQCSNTGQPWSDAVPRSSLTSVSAGRWQSHIKISENPKVPVRSVNSSIVPAPHDSKGQV